jgi:hypothetical protein
MLAECMFRQVEAKALETVQAARFISLSCDEVTLIDNGSWISIHYYVEEQATSVNLLRLILNTVKLKGGVYGSNLVHKLMSFGVGE